MFGNVAPQWVRQMGALAAILLCGVLTSGCAQLGGSIQSQVRDVQTNQPISGAAVLGVWTKRVGFPGLDHTELVGNREAETDAEGRFTLERPAGIGTGEEWVAVYKFGYVAWSNIYIFQVPRGRPDPTVPPQIQLDPFPPGASHDEHIRFIYKAISSSVSRRGDRHRFDEAIRREREGR
ncbi:MAG: hypothetical protein NTW68_08475 [candidate division NC10 bacterium]|nr:hypothetical protein [candidate division NC10 bacterium]